MLATIEDVQEKLYTALTSLEPGWHDRPEIAKAIGKKTLNPVDMLALDLLARDGKIEKVSQPVLGDGRGSNITRWVYRARE